jgi:soluble lytic murein transglycosylase-like protein
MSSIMADNNLFSIQHHHSRKILGGVRGYIKYPSNRPSVSGQNPFKSILSVAQNRSLANKVKTRGLTIADYRAQPVTAKSRFRPQPPPAASIIANKIFNRFPTPSLSAVQKKERPASAGPNGQAIDLASKSVPKIQHQPPVLTERQMIEKSVRKAAAKYNLSPRLLRAIIRAESNFEVAAVSRAGAKGLMQLMPATAKDMGVTDIFDIEQNIDGGAKYMRQMLNRFGGNIRKALAAYNAGPATVIKYNGRVPYPETRQYVDRVLQFSRLTA